MALGGQIQALFSTYARLHRLPTQTLAFYDIGWEPLLRGGGLGKGEMEESMFSAPAPRDDSASSPRSLLSSDAIEAAGAAAAVEAVVEVVAVVVVVVCSSKRSHCDQLSGPAFGASSSRLPDSAVACLPHLENAEGLSWKLGAF